MRKLTMIIGMLVSATLLTSCGAGYAYVYNHNSNSTQVQLREKNFEVVGQAMGDSQVSYVFVFGGVNKRRLYENAYTEMVKNAELTGSRALANIVTEEHIGGVPPFYYTRTITVSANVIEFTK